MDKSEPDRTQLALTYTYSLRWNPPEGTAIRRQSVYLLHGTGEHAGRYAPLAERLCRAGYRVGAHDHRGHGLSGGKRGVIHPPGALAAQAAIEYQGFASETGTRPVLFGHSLGGVLACELVLDHGLQVGGLILSAPAFVPRLSRSDWLKVQVLLRLAPQFAVKVAYDASRLTHDKVIADQAEADPLNHGYRSASLVDWLVSSGARQLSMADKLEVDTLLLIAGDDPVVDSSQTEVFAKAAPAHKLTKHCYEGYLHEILNETPERAERVLNDIEHWMLERFASF